MRRTLNRTKPYGQSVRGPWCYFQDGRYFDFNGYEVDINGNPIILPDPESFVQAQKPEPQVPEKPAPVVYNEDKDEQKNVQADTEQQSTKDREQTIICPECGFVATSQWAARAHKRAHLEEQRKGKNP